MRKAKALAVEERPWSSARALLRELTAMGALGLALVLCLLAITWVGLETLGSVRGYVAGAGMYNKAQKDALYQLARYAETGDEGAWRRYEQAIAVPLAAGDARSALERAEPDLLAAREAMLRVRNQPEVADGMVMLFRLGRRLPAMQRALAVWRERDAAAHEIVATAEALRAAVRSGASAEPRARILARLDAIDGRLAALDGQFVDNLAAGSRRVQNVVFATAALGGALFAVVALVTAARWLTRQRRVEKLFRSLTEDAQDIVNLVDRAGMLRYVSPAAERHLGWRPAQLLNRSALEFIHPEDGAGVVGAITRCFERPGEPQSAEFRFRHRDGSWRSFEASGRVLSTANGPPLVIVVSRDVTERRQLEARLREAHKMESLGRLAGGVAHDFNNLLTAILGSAELLRSDLPEGSPQRAELDEIARSGGRAARLTSQLLAFARRQPLELRVVDLAVLLREIEELLRRLLPLSVELVIEAGPGPATVRGAPDQLEQVLVNLVVNARDALGDSGRITLGTERTGERVRLTVRDTGPGMSEEVQQRAFEPFFTTKAPGQGTGLGLATCYGIVEQSGGRITMSSAPGQGTAVHIELPFVSDEAARAAAPPRELRRERDLTVLLAEDEPAVRRITALALRRAGHRVLEAEDGAAALRLAEAGGDEIDVLVSDVVMPSMGGRALAAALRERHPELPVLFVSGYTEDEALRREVAAPHTAFLAKPFSAELLCNRLDELVAGRKPREAAAEGSPYPAAVPGQAAPRAERGAEVPCPTPAPSKPTTPTSLPPS
jgi:PAS domain S-box-containing protein